MDENQIDDMCVHSIQTEEEFHDEPNVNSMSTESDEASNCTDDVHNLINKKELKEKQGHL